MSFSLRERLLIPNRARVALLLAQGRSNTEIAAEFVVSPHTAQRYTERVLRKPEIPSRSEAVGRLYS